MAQKVLIIDDDKFLINMYAKKLTENGFEVKTAESGQAGIDTLRGGFSPDAIVVDVVMPGMNGLEFIKTIRTEKISPQSRCIMLSNQSDAGDIKAAKDLGVDGYIIKATSVPSEVVNKVREILSGKQTFATGF